MQTTPLSTGPCDSQRVRAQRGRQNLRTGESEPGDFCPCREPPHRRGPGGWDWAAGLGQGVGSRGRSPCVPQAGPCTRWHRAGGACTPRQVAGEATKSHFLQFQNVSNHTGRRV